MIRAEQVAAPAVVPQQEKQWPNLLTLAYLAGAGIQLALFFCALARIFLLMRRSEKITHKGLRLALVRQPVVPFCFGRRIVISHKDFNENGQAIMLHEQTHLQAFHGIDLLVAECCLVLTWYNPFSWLIRHELKQNHEFEADRNVLRRGIDGSDYQLLLVRTAAGEPRYLLANQFNQSNLKTRIVMMNKTKSGSGAMLKLLFFIPLIAMMVAVFAQKVVKPATLPAGGHPHGKYLEIAPEQLRLLGFTKDPAGLYYKNTRFGNPDKGVLCLYFTEKTYSGCMILRPGEKIEGNSSANKILKKQPLTNLDFYPVVVAGYDRSRTQDMMAAEKKTDLKLLPVQINMGKLNLGKRADTIVVWFKPTSSLKEVLAGIANTDDYLQTCPADTRDVKAKVKK